MVQLSLCLIDYSPRHEDVWGRGSLDPPLVNSALNGSGQLHASASLPPVGPRTDLDPVKKKKLSPLPVMGSRALARRYTDCAMKKYSKWAFISN
jgi:hypothetical protein